MNTLDAQYIELLEYIIENGVEKKDRTGTGTLSIFGYQIRHKMSEGFPLLTTKKMHWKSIVSELLWFLRGDTNIKYLIDNDCHIWDGDCYNSYVKKIQSDYTTDNPKFKDGVDCYYKPVTGTVLEDIGSKYSLYAEPFTKEQFINKIKTDEEFAEQWGDLGPIYGKQWRKWGAGVLENKYGFCIDQIANLLKELEINPDSRRLMVNAWNVGELPQMVLPPCHYGFQVWTRKRTRDEKIVIPGKYHAISLMWNQRSVDTFLGLPFNIASYGLLLEIIAKEVNMVPEYLIGNLGDTHLYLNHIEQANEQILREPYQLPTLDIHPGILDYDLDKLDKDMFQIKNYTSHPPIKAPLSN